MTILESLRTLHFEHLLVITTNYIYMYNVLDSRTCMCVIMMVCVCVCVCVCDFSLTFLSIYIVYTLYMCSVSLYARTCINGEYSGTSE